MNFVIRYFIMSCTFTAFFHSFSIRWQRYYIAVLTGIFVLIALIFLI